MPSHPDRVRRAYDLTKAENRDTLAKSEESRNYRLFELFADLLVFLDSQADLNDYGEPNKAMRLASRCDAELKDIKRTYGL